MTKMKNRRATFLLISSTAGFLCGISNEAQAISLPDTTSPCTTVGSCLKINNTNTSGASSGIFGLTINGTAVQGTGSGSSSTGGAFFVNTSAGLISAPTGVAVTGVAKGNTVGVYGLTDGSVGVAVKGVATSGGSPFAIHGIVPATSSGTAIVGDGGNSASTLAGLFLGNVQITGLLNGMTINFSDARLKKDIRESPYGLEEILKLRPVTYRWKNPTTTDRTQIGLIAQELQQVIPEIVYADRDGILSVNYTALLPVIVKAMKEQKITIDRQEERIAALERGRGPATSSLLTGGIGFAFAFGLLPIGLIAGRLRRKNR